MITALEDIQGEVIESFIGLEKYSDEVTLKTRSGRLYRFHHDQDCCEKVQLEDFDGEACDLINATVLSITESAVDLSSSNGYEESATATFYTINTDKGHVWMRWLGESNGYYSEAVDFERYLPGTCEYTDWRGGWDKEERK
ncbi:DUF7448 domain-containing protein [Carnimonas bestiolae]|uniref:DUF7448 domain-containing protein n=1 Tax=Carnimonas bestiolae TaxID=3402172 RepID=UPI003EDC376A